MRHVSPKPGSSCGLLSLRFWTQVVNVTAQYVLNRRLRKQHEQECQGMQPCPVPLGDFGGSIDSEMDRMCKTDLAAFDLAKLDCWVRADRLDNDFAECMDKYERRGGILKMSTSQLTTLVPPERVTEHPPCKEMFDRPLGQLVEGLDRLYADIFGYPGTCCAAGPLEPWPWTPRP
mmetsp:Transcript_21174/g.61103  ORF Transcript_21174/g.61103 Transcript_21174/m.61103 type:complete len:175 (-) Transcript_21174:41-565(-)